MRGRHRELYPVERMVFFTDAVVAIAMTLLILPLLESVTEAAAAGLSTREYVIEHDGQLVAFALSFVVISVFWRGHDRWLPNWALNLMGLVYLPLLALDILASGRAQALRPVLHLALYGLVAKLFSLRRERDKWQVTIGLFVVFLAAMATSVHPAVLLYLAAFLGAALWTLVRFAYLHLLASFGQRELPGVKLPVARLLAVSTVATLVLAVMVTALVLVSWQARQALREANRAQALQNFVAGLFESAGNTPLDGSPGFT